MSADATSREMRRQRIASLITRITYRYLARQRAGLSTDVLRARSTRLSKVFLALADYNQKEVAP